MKSCGVFSRSDVKITTREYYSTNKICIPRIYKHSIKHMKNEEYSQL